MPVWHKATRPWAADGRLVVLGMTQEAHPDRCRLFAQWQQFDWPILWDPINVTESAAVPIIVAIDEHGIVRSLRPRPETLEREFLSQSFEDDAPERVGEPGQIGKEAATRPPDLVELSRHAEQAGTARAWRDLADALVLWGGGQRLDDAIAAYNHARRIDPGDGNVLFRLGVSHRMRHETDGRQSDDFQRAVRFWEQALAIDPNQYIWRRRIQQYGPRLDKPYPFYDWVDTARRDIKSRGDQPVPLGIDPYGAEIARPSRQFDADTATTAPPDPDGKLFRDETRLIETEIVLVPTRIRAGGTARVHVTFRPNAARKAHWNNEAEPLRVWIDAPDGWQVSQRLLTAPSIPAASGATSNEVRRIDFEIHAPQSASGTVVLPAYAVYYVCEDEDGKCLFLRQDLAIKVEVSR